MINISKIIEVLGYFGVFIAGLISSSTIFVPLPLYVIVAASKQLGLNIYISIILASIGVTIGELTSYFIGFGIRKIKEFKIKKWEKFFKKYGFLAIFVLALIPFPFFDIIGLLAGYLKYDIKKFLIATFIGKFIKISLIGIFGDEIIEIVKSYIY